MDDDALREALDGLFAYDSGSRDSGIHDENLRRKCIAALKEREPWPSLSRLVRDMWLSEEALEQGYGIEDALEFCEWLEDRMEVEIRG